MPRRRNNKSSKQQTISLDKFRAGTYKPRQEHAPPVAAAAAGPPPPNCVRPVPPTGLLGIASPLFRTTVDEARLLHKEYLNNIIHEETKWAGNHNKRRELRMKRIQLLKADDDIIVSHERLMNVVKQAATIAVKRMHDHMRDLQRADEFFARLCVKRWRRFVHKRVYPKIHVIATKLRADVQVEIYSLWRDVQSRRSAEKELNSARERDQLLENMVWTHLNEYNCAYTHHANMLLDLFRPTIAKPQGKFRTHSRPPREYTRFCEDGEHATDLGMITCFDVHPSEITDDDCVLVSFTVDRLTRNSIDDMTYDGCYDDLPDEYIKTQHVMLVFRGLKTSDRGKQEQPHKPSVFAAGVLVIDDDEEEDAEEEDAKDDEEDEDEDDNCLIAVPIMWRDDISSADVVRHTGMLRSHVFESEGVVAKRKPKYISKFDEQQYFGGNFRLLEWCDLGTMPTTKLFVHMMRQRWAEKGTAGIATMLPIGTVETAKDPMVCELLARR